MATKAKEGLYKNYFLYIILIKIKLYEEYNPVQKLVNEIRLD
jgi:hypothetical protein